MPPLPLPFTCPLTVPADDAAVGLPAPPAAAAAKLFRMMLPLGSGAAVEAVGDCVPGVVDGGGGGGGLIGAQTTCCSRGASAIFSVGPRGNVLAVCTS